MPGLDAVSSFNRESPNMPVRKENQSGPSYFAKQIPF